MFGDAVGPGGRLRSYQCEDSTTSGRIGVDGGYAISWFVVVSSDVCLLGLFVIQLAGGYG